MMRTRDLRERAFFECYQVYCATTTREQVGCGDVLFAEVEVSFGVTGVVPRFGVRPSHSTRYASLNDIVAHVTGSLVV